LFKINGEYSAEEYADKELARKDNEHVKPSSEVGYTRRPEQCYLTAVVPETI